MKSGVAKQQSFGYEVAVLTRSVTLISEVGYRFLSAHWAHSGATKASKPIIVFSMRNLMGD